MRASSRKSMINGGGEGYGATASYAPGLLCRLRGLPTGARAGAITVGPPALEPWAGSPLARV